MNVPVKKAMGIVGGLGASLGLVLAVAEIVDKRNEAATLGAELASLRVQRADLVDKNERLFSLAVAVREGSVPLDVLKPFVSQVEVSEVSEEAAQSRKEQWPFPVDALFYPSGWMGDGESGERFVVYRRRAANVDGQETTVIALTYRRGPKGFAGIYWQYPDANFGEKPGRNLVGARRVSFLAKGEHGGEIVEFKSGGISGRYRDSYEVSLGKIVLQREWTKYTLNLSSSDLSSVIGVFAWEVAASDNEGTEVTTYIANLQVE
jgi:hypothetical protein